MRQKQAKSEITKEKILTAAEAEFSEKGFFGARIDEIAALSGFNKRMIYEHFGSKEELYKQVLLSVYRKLAECEREFFVENPEPALAIKNFAYAFFHFFEQTPSFVRMLMWENLNNAQFVSEDEVRKLKQPTIDYIISQIKRGKKQGIFKEEIDEYQVVVSLMNFGFSYFTNIHTLSIIFNKDMSAASEINSRAEFVSNMILNSLMK
ncbi:MAG: TetR/AcrR family transcriptional regulator [Ruminococcaceae bacterium]|nr:TetR/AcrR family transcriptional regulator [Oscillospiraceae bacterium]